MATATGLMEMAAISAVSLFFATPLAPLIDSTFLQPVWHLPVAPPPAVKLYPASVQMPWFWSTQRKALTALPPPQPRLPSTELQSTVHAGSCFEEP